MESTSNHVQQRHSSTYAFHTQMYSPALASQPVVPQYSSLRSSAQLGSQPTTPQPFYLGGFSQPPSTLRYQDDHPSFSSGSSLLHHDMVARERPQDFTETQYTFVASNVPHYQPQVPRSIAWAQDKPQLYHEYASTPEFGTVPGESRYSESVSAYDGGYFDNVSKPQSYIPAELGPFYGAQDSALAQEPALTAYTTQENVLPSVVYNASGSPRLNAQSMGHPHSGSPSSTYAISSPSLQYPSTPENGVPPRFVSMQDVSPSPTVSPDQVYTSLPPNSPAHEFPIARVTYDSSQASSTSPEYEGGILDMLTMGSGARRSSLNEPQPRKRPRVSDDDSLGSGVSVDSGESEREEDGEDADDDEYTPHQETSRVTRTRRMSLRQSNMAMAARSVSPVDVPRPKLAPPVPVPNLTKKSRGRRVPTNAVVVSQNGIDKNIRSYRCKVPGCNKCFQRGEHLKRHVRSIHTNDKPHKCPYKSCGKDFSRHDNLRQHMRVHRNEPLESDTSA